METQDQIESGCHACALRSGAEAKPNSLLSKLWRWHTGWCPGWRAYVKELTAKGVPIPKV